MSSIAVIGGSGFQRLAELQIDRRIVTHTPYGDPSSPLVFGQYAGRNIVFLPRHGQGHTIPPHLVNYRANIWALKSQGVSKIIALAAVGSITESFHPVDIAFPDQLVDYTSSREHSFWDGRGQPVIHIDFSYPYCTSLRDVLCKSSADSRNINGESCTYAATQGPRFETAAEIARLQKDGADVVGMTGMPEAALARELGMCYATMALIVNPAAGKTGSRVITMDAVQKRLEIAVKKVSGILEKALPEVDSLVCEHPGAMTV